MSLISEQLRALVVARAGDRCEYCHVPQQGQAGRFPIDHVRPRRSGGRTEPENLALACPHCNARKWARVDWPDTDTGELVGLFNPRTQLWGDHFEWSDSLPPCSLGRGGLELRPGPFPRGLADDRLVHRQPQPGDGKLDSGDKLLGYAIQASPGVWTLTFSTTGWAAGTYTLFAQAEDSYGIFGDPFAITLTVQ